MKFGEVIESAIWITGDEPRKVRKRFEADVERAIADLCAEYGVIHGPVQWTEKHPMDDRVPDPPNDVQGSRVRLLVGEAPILANAPLVETDSFVANLDRTDLMRLRALTRQNAKQALSDLECDSIIEQLGPRAALETLRAM